MSTVTMTQPTTAAAPDLKASAQHVNNADKSIPEGHIGSLTLEEERKLQQFWTRILDICGKRPATPPADGEAPLAPTMTNGNTKRASSIVSSTSVAKDAANDKYGQTAEFQQYLATQSPADIHRTLWAAIKCDHPDSALLRFLRARKWDVDKAVVMLISTVKWRQDVSVDDDIVAGGEAVALSESPTEDDKGFMLQYRSGKSYVRGLDNDRRPVYIVKPRLHNPREQTAKAMENYILHTIESIRVLIEDPYDTACLIFDLGGFGLRNMDFPAVQFIVQVFEARYPETLGVVLVHNAPWVFHGIWRVVKTWLDPVVASKIHFTKSNADLLEFIPRSSLQAEYGGDDPWTYTYAEPQAGENAAMDDAEARDRLRAERTELVDRFERATAEWAQMADPAAEEARGKEAERHALAKGLKENYWRLDPCIRSRNLYDRMGILNEKGEVDFAPKK